MRLLLDTHILLMVVDGRPGRFGATIESVLRAPDHAFFASTASLWEIAIKWRLGKLDLAVAPRALPDLLRNLGMTLLPVGEWHALTELLLEPQTRDPFDRMLLAQCQEENMRLLTADRALAAHPLSFAAAG